MIINNNNNNPMEGPQDLILLFKIPMGMRKDFFEIHRQFEHTRSKISPALFYPVNRRFEERTRS